MDPIKPSDSPSSPSPISPPIKVPPLVQQPTLSSPPSGTARSVPPNLPIKEGVISPPVFKSSIRTMQEDAAAIKKGQPPAGFQIEKQSEKDTKMAIEPTKPKITLPPGPATEVRLGELEKSRPLPKPPPVVLPPPVKPLPIEKTKLVIPSSAGRTNIKRLIILVGGLIIVAFLVWFFALRSEVGPEITFSPTPSPTLTATPVQIENSFSILDSVSVPLGADFTNNFDGSLNKESLTSTREPALYKVLNPTSGQRYLFSEFLSGLLIPAPTELISAAYDDNFYLSALYKSDNKMGYGFIVKLREPITAITALANWEGLITQDLKNLFLFNPALAASTVFLDNTYQGVAIRYKNFPDHMLTIDYAVFAAKDGESYLVITNSREHIYAIIDRIK